VFRWPIREALLAYLQIIKEQTRRDYAVSLQVWASKTAFGGSSKPPKVPDLLK
jgi:hypothetical protein